MALTNGVTNADVIALFRTYADEGYTTAKIDLYIGDAFTLIENMLQSMHGVDPSTITADHSSRFNLSIIYKTLELIYSDLRPDEDTLESRYAAKEARFAELFLNAWDALDYTVDTDGDGDADTDIDHNNTLDVARG